ncbi:MAG: SDR family NAD(P)-dependent oxidoreductase [Pseudomonadota bacterium]
MPCHGAAPPPTHVLITGASSGLGAALARTYARPGRRLTLWGRDAGRLDAAAASGKAKGAVVDQTIVDVTTEPQVAMAMAAADANQPLDLVIANAGIAGANDAPAAGADVIAVNLLGTWHTATAAIRSMRPRRRGQLALLSSLAGERGLPGAAAYSASKAGVRVLAEAWRAELAPVGLRVSAVCPGFVDTPLTRRNRFAMPWLLEADDAAERIQRGLAADRARIGFPWQLDLLTRLAARLPADLVDPVLRRRRRPDRSAAG